MSRLWLHKKVHWSDTDAAGIVWFPNYFGWFEDAEEELYAVVVGRHRQALLDELCNAARGSQREVQGACSSGSTDSHWNRRDD